ncbi:hypothetical protein [Halovibrio sp. HP20-50]|jgi:hypothetical protein|uniref:hypothetical protein n=1 Tax=Halovibrio sp. HP20-59 TaxID=3080275 RepID=UPI00294B5044|nr:hypothetical protein [Halovibrio sp. HP20-59]MEA2118773.1 hypothetical protein [Halovibrio sp. HP20-59]
MKKTSLYEEVFATYERACRDEDFEVADHLFQTLEAIAQREGEEAWLQRAYAVFIRSVPKYRGLVHH